MAGTTATDAVLILYRALKPEERESVFERISALRLEELAGQESEMARVITSLARVAEHLGRRPTATTYRTAFRELTTAGEDLVEFNAVVRHFGSWSEALEALDLSATTTPRRIEARFAKRRVGKVWRYTSETLKQTLADCVAAIGHVPQVAEFEWWRQRELELAQARGDDAMHLPSTGAFRRRWGSWEKALLACGYTPDQVAERLEK